MRGFFENILIKVAFTGALNIGGFVILSFEAFETRHQRKHIVNRLASLLS